MLLHCAQRWQTEHGLLCFHVLTFSFPEPGTLKVEPTESETLAEVDRFIDAMIDNTRREAASCRCVIVLSDQKSFILQTSP